MSVNWEDLPNECLELVFNLLLLDDDDGGGHNSHLKSLSLVCKRFLSISNPLRTNLVIIDPTNLSQGNNLSKFLHRFDNLNSIDLREFQGDLDLLFREMAHSDLILETLNLSKRHSLPLEGLRILGSNLKGLRVLKCSEMVKFRDVELITIANSMPYLEEIDFSNPHNNNPDYTTQSAPVMLSEMGVTNDGIKKLSSKLINLRRINMSGNYLISDQSLVYLSLNCVLIREIVAKNCAFITPYGIHFVMSNSVSLSSISVNSIRLNSIYALENSVPRMRDLHTLKLPDSVVSDEFLHSIVKACFPLKNLNLSGCANFTMSGLSSLLFAYQSLESLALDRVNSITDQVIVDLSPFLHNLVTIKLNFCFNISDLAFFTLAKNCHLLKRIEMQNTKLGKENCSDHLVRNPRISSLKLGSSFLLSDEVLERIAYVCPRLKILDISSCSAITERGLTEVLTRCRELKHLVIDDCWGIKSISTCWKLGKLEVLHAARSKITDEGLSMIGKLCPGLVNLNLEACIWVTKEGVEEVVTKCKRLREINLKFCHKLDVGIVDWMVFSRPSLRKIVPPQHSSHTESQLMLFLRHGCLVCHY